MDPRQKNRDEKEFTPPHREFTGLFNQQLSRLMRRTYEEPDKMKKVPFYTGAMGAALMMSPFIQTRIPRPISAGFFMVGAAGALASLTASLFQHKIFGFPITNDSLYQQTSYTYGSAHAELLVDDIHFPRLNIKATDPFDAGYVEGYVLGEAIRANLNADAIQYLFKLVYIVIGFPNEEEYRAYFTDILATIPEEYKAEMDGKVRGFNAWRQKYYPNEKPLLDVEYTFFQGVAEYLNYIPFKGCRFAPLLQHIGCTTFALRVGNATFFSRILDWLACGQAGYFIEIQKQIADKQTITDIAHPLVSGALTVRNSRFLFEMNVAHGLKVTGQPKGMPAVFFNRYCAEKTRKRGDLDWILKHKQPLSAYHLTVMGVETEETESIHFFQDLKDPSQHVIEKLNPDKTKPQLLVVTNNGIQEQEGKVVPYNYRDSDERKENIYAFFNQRKIQDPLKSYIAKQERGNALSPEDFNAIREIIWAIARLPLVCNLASVLFAVFESEKGELKDAYATVDNSFAPARCQFRRSRL